MSILYFIKNQPSPILNGMDLSNGMNGNMKWNGMEWNGYLKGKRRNLATLHEMICT